MNEVGMMSVLVSSLSFNQTSASPVIDNDFVKDRMSGIARYLYDSLGTINESTGEANYDVAGFVLLLLIYALSAIVFKLGFAKALPLWQNIIIYFMLFLGCIMLTFFAFFLPILEGLLVAALILIVYKSRMWREKREERRNAT